MEGPSAATCLAEQARQLQISKTHPLLNRRNIAAKAANAWGEEALLAEERESDQRGPLSKQDAAIAKQFADDALARRRKNAR